MCHSCKRLLQDTQPDPELNCPARHPLHLPHLGNVHSSHPGCGTPPRSRDSYFPSSESKEWELRPMFSCTQWKNHQWFQAEFPFHLCLSPDKTISDASLRRSANCGRSSNPSRYTRSRANHLVQPSPGSRLPRHPRHPLISGMFWIWLLALGILRPKIGPTQKTWMDHKKTRRLMTIR